MKKAVYRLILFAAITAFVLSVSTAVKADPNDTQTKQKQGIASDTKPLPNADKPGPTPQQESADSKENYPQRLEDEKSKANAYKDDVDSLKWAIKVIIGMFATFVTFAVAMMGYLVYKSDKAYKEDFADAKEAARDAKDAAKNAKDAAKNARELENEAQAVLADFEKQTKAKLEEIDTKANDKQDNIDELVAEKLKEIDTKANDKQQNIDKLVTNKLKEIEKTSKKQKEESSSEFERQRKISELVNKGWKALDAKDYQIADDYYRQIVEDLKEENDHSVYNNWGNALWRLAESKKGSEAEELFKQAADKCQNAVEIKSNDNMAYTNWGAALIGLSCHKKGKDAEDLLKQAEEKCLKAESIKAGEGAYNLACVYARRGNEDKCQEWLKVREKAGTLEAREYAMGDDDLKIFREKDWFKELRWKGE